MKRLLIICMLVVLGNGVFGQGIEFMDNEPWSKVLQRAKEQNQLIFMDCYTVWCGPCKGLAQDVFPQKQVGDFFNVMGKCYVKNTRSISLVFRLYYYLMVMEMLCIKWLVTKRRRT